MIAYGGDQVPHGTQSVYVSLNRSGFPRIIPAFHRHKIMRRNSESDRLVQLYLSWFSLYRIILLASKINSSTFRAMTEPVPDIDRVKEWVGSVRGSICSLTLRYIPALPKIPLHQGFLWEPTWKTVPTMALANKSLSRHHSESGSKWGGPYRSSFHAMMFEMASYASLIQFIHSREEQFSSGVLWPQRVRYALDKMNKHFTNIDLEYFEKAIGPTLPTSDQLGLPAIFGRLGQAIQQGTKRRFFSMGNYINQRLLHPLHEWCAMLLRRLLTDGTFHQEAPLDRLRGMSVCHCYDLKSATDRWPLLLMFEMVQSFFDRSFASATVNSALATAVFEVPFVAKLRPVSLDHAAIEAHYRDGVKLEQDRTLPKLPVVVAFVAGQPLGLKSSWPLFALSHHFVVWRAAENVYPGRRFLDYAVLGDDVIICDDAVAAEYLKILDTLQVAISKGKSLVSHRGCGEYAKRFRVRNLQVDFSPVSVAALLNYYHPYGLLSVHVKYKVKRFSTLCRIGGMGYRSLGRFKSKLPKKYQRLHILYTKPPSRSSFDHAVEWWLCRGLPMNPYIRGYLVDLLRSKLIPKDITPAPEDAFVFFKVREFQEYTVLRRWVRQYLNYLGWYCKVALSPDVTIDQLFRDAPVVEKNFKISKVEPTAVRFGLLLSLYDLYSDFESGKKTLNLALSEFGTSIDNRVVVIDCIYTFSSVYSSVTSFSFILPETVLFQEPVLITSGISGSQ